MCCESSGIYDRSSTAIAAPDVRTDAIIIMKAWPPFFNAMPLGIYGRWTGYDYEKRGGYFVLKCSKNYKLTKYLLLSPNIPACPWAEWLWWLWSTVNPPGGRGRYHPLAPLWKLGLLLEKWQKVLARVQREDLCMLLRLMEREVFIARTVLFDW